MGENWQDLANLQETTKKNQANISHASLVSLFKIEIISLYPEQ